MPRLQPRKIPAFHRVAREQRPSCRLSRRWFVAALAAATLLACADTDFTEPAAPLDPPDADRQAWDVQLQTRGPATELVVLAPYLADHLEARQTRADSGAVVLLVERYDGEAASRDTSRIEASTLIVDHRDGSVTFSGEVRVDGGDVHLVTDSLRWSRDTDSLAVPRRSQMSLAEGEVTAQWLAGTTRLSRWAGRQVFASFPVTSGGATHRIGIEGRTASIEVDGGRVMARFDTVTSRWRDKGIHALAASWHGDTKHVDLSGAVSVEESGGDSGRALHADTARYDLRHDRFEASGHVQLHETDRALTASHLVDHEQGWEASGDPVVVTMTDRRVQALHVTYDAATDRLRLSGKALIDEGTRTLRADTVELVPGDDRLEAGQVHLTSEEFAGALSASSMVSRQGGASVRLSGQPVLRRETPNGGVTVSADTVDLDMEAQRLRGAGHFRLLAEHLALAAGSGDFDAGADTLSAVGGTVVDYRQGASRQSLKSATVRVALEEGRARRVSWPETLSGRLDDEEQTTWIDAPEGGDLSLRDGRLDTLVLRGTPRVVHRSTGSARGGGPGNDRASRFSADEMQLLFSGDGALRQLHAIGSATSLTRLVDEAGEVSVNEVGGARLQIDLVDGAVSAVSVLDEIEGRYLPSEPDDEGSAP